MTYDVVTLSDDREHVLAREHCGLAPDATGIVEEGVTVYWGEDEVFATVVPLDRR